MAKKKLRKSTLKKYLKIVQAHFYGADKWTISENLDCSLSTVDRALNWYRDETSNFNIIDFLKMRLEETTNQKQHMWSYVRTLQEGLPETVIYKGDMVAEIRKHYPGHVNQAFREIQRLREQEIALKKLLSELSGEAEFEKPLKLDLTIREADETEEEWQKRMSGEDDTEDDKDDDGE